MACNVRLQKVSNTIMRNKSVPEPISGDQYPYRHSCTEFWQGSHDSFHAALPKHNKTSDILVDQYLNYQCL